MPKPSMTIRTATPSDKKQWDSVAAHPLQSWEWGEFRESMGVTTERLVGEVNGKVHSGWQLTFHPIPHTPFSVGYFPKGPEPDKKMIKELKKLGEKHKALSIQIEPLLEETPSFHPEELGLVPSPHPLFTKFTFLLDLTKTEDELLKQMHSKTRYNIRLAEKHNVTVQEDNSDTAFQSYLTLNDETTGRQGFYAHNHRYHETMWRVMKKAGIAHLFTATYQGEILAAWLIFAWQKTIYYPYGTSSRNHREVMAPTLLLWKIVLWAKEHGYTALDLWGALPIEADTNGPWYGFHRFKQGFTPRHVTFVGSYDIVIQPLLYRAFNVLNSLRWFILRLKAGK